MGNVKNKRTKAGRKGAKRQKHLDEAAQMEDQTVETQLEGETQMEDKIVETQLQGDTQVEAKTPDAQLDEYTQLEDGAKEQNKDTFQEPEEDEDVNDEMKAASERANDDVESADERASDDVEAADERANDDVEAADEHLMKETAASERTNDDVQDADVSNRKRRRGPTRMRHIARDPNARQHVDFTDMGEPCGPGSVLLSSYLGPLVREHVPVIIENWKKVGEDIKSLMWKTITVISNF